MKLTQKERMAKTDPKAQLDAYSDAWQDATKATPAMLGNGMARGAAEVFKSRPYQLHVKEAEALGESPMTYEAFTKSRKP